MKLTFARQNAYGPKKRNFGRERKAMNWTDLTTEEQTNNIGLQSNTQPVIIFKHSTRCSISSMAKNRLEKITGVENTVFYYLDLIRYRALSDKIAADYHVHHESPQALLIVNGECVYEESHNGITASDLTDEINQWRTRVNG